ncbi:MAG: Asp-tRNA(Asn)/Glu-tRNA(Gln) amidotransferase subunit GatA [Deltaproteobacteria bacterium]|nr:Asp-tRNA(Asn)/Glu-tRNA(Gln) amidotransferase subunit GatA [Deltaproteobacteria bacterium]
MRARFGQQVAALEAGSTTSTALLERSLAAIAARDPGLHAFLDVDVDGARAMAAASDARRAKGNARSRLDGVPVALKDNLAQEGRPTTAASRILEGYRPPYDATCVARLKNAGAVIVGKTNLDEFGMGSSTENSAFGPTLNPWDHARTPGGSSGGSAAAVAAGFVAGALGTDTGGSVRQPAAFCGVVGVKPTYGRVSRFGVFAFGSSLDQVGVISDDVDGAALLLSAIAGFDGARDGTSSERTLGSLDDDDVTGLKIGVPRALLSGIDPAIAAGLSASEDRLKERGAVVVDVELPHCEHAVAAYYVIAMAEASSNLARYDGVRFGPRTSGRHGGARGEGLEGLYESTRALFGPEVRRRLLLGSFVLSAGFYDAYVEQAQRVRTLIARGFDAAFSTCDAILLPTTPTLPFLLGAKARDPLAMYLGDLFTLPASLAGLPALSVPAPSSSSSSSSSSLPVGMQLVGRAFDEPTLFRLARALFTPVAFPGDDE